MRHAIFLCVPLLLGCAGLGGLETTPSRYTETYMASFDDVWSAALVALKDMDTEPDEVDKDKGKMKTRWLYKQTSRRMGMVFGGYWKERLRLYISVSSRGEATEVSLLSRMEEKRPGGTQAYRWHRMESTGELEKELLSGIRKVLAEAKKEKKEG